MACENFRRLIVFIVLTSLLACQSTSHLVQMENGPVDRLSLSDGEKRLWSMSEDAEIQIRRSGKLLKIKKAEAALTRILNSLYPEQIGNMKIRIVKQPILNAFAFPNGALYIHTGIISAAKNEAQIAAVVAHEGAHYILKHSAKSRIKRSNMTSFSLMLTIIGIPLIGELIGISSVMGYSQDLEREADAMGAERMLAAGYDVREAQKMFEFMAADAKANEIESPFFFASHPKLQERIENFKIFASKNVQQDIQILDEELFKDDFFGVYTYALHKKLEVGKYSSLINEIETDDFLWEKLKSPSDRIVFVEAYRLRGKKDDDRKSKELCLRILKENSDYWKPYFTMGILAFENKEYLEAESNFIKAKELSGSRDSYIEMYLNKIKNLEDVNNAI